MKKNEETDINTAFMQGLIGLAAVFYVLRDRITEINKDIFVSLVILFVVLSLIRVFGVILKVESIKVLSVDFFAILCVPYTLYVASRIILTQFFETESVKNTLIISIPPFYIFIFSIAYMFLWHYDLEIRFRFPIDIRKKKRREEKPPIETPPLL